MRIIKDRNDRESNVARAFHKPIGDSCTRRGMSMSIAEILKKTSLQERQKMLEDSPLWDEFQAGNKIPSEKILDYVDLSVSPIDLTDAAALRELALQQYEDYKQKYDAYTAEKAAKLREISNNKTSDPVESGKAQNQAQNRGI